MDAIRLFGIFFFMQWNSKVEAGEGGGRLDSFCTVLSTGIDIDLGDGYTNRHKTHIGHGPHNFPHSILDVFDLIRDPCKPNPAVCDVIPIIEVKAITTPQGPLNGWLRVRVDFLSSLHEDREILGFYIAAETDEVFELGSSTNAKDGRYNQAMGEFVSEFPTTETCPPTEPTKYQLIPCGGIGRSELFFPNGVLFVAYNAPWPEVNFFNGTKKSANEYILKHDRHSHHWTEFDFYFRFSQYYCNARRFYFRMFTITHRPNGSNTLAVYPSRTPYITPKKLVGAWDPLPKGDKARQLNCNQSLSEVMWVNDVTEPKLLDLRSKESCQGVFTGKSGASSPRKENDFVFGHRYKGSSPKEHQAKEYTGFHSVRCSAGNSIVDENDEMQMHYCKLRGNSPMFELREYLDHLQSYEDYLFHMYQDHNEKCLCIEQWATLKPEPEPPEPDPEKMFTTPMSGGITDSIINTTAVPEIITPELVATLNPQPPPVPEGLIQIRTGKKFGLDPIKGIRADIRTGKLVWSSRIGHGILMAFVTLFITPINIFVTRYFKETFMSTRILHFRVWNFVHIQAIPNSLAFLFAGLACTVVGRKALGHSLSDAASYHRKGGWLFFALFIFSTFFGGIRCIQNSSRIICIAFHFGSGIVFYIGSLAMIFISVKIPGNPMTDSDHGIGTESAITYIWAWIVFDILMHVIMTVHMIMSDGGLGRMYLPVPIPKMRENSLIDAPKSFFRKCCLCLYVVVALANTILVCSTISQMSIKGRGFGPHYCTHYNATHSRQRLLEDCIWGKTTLEELKADQVNARGNLY